LFIFKDNEGEFHFRTNWHEAVIRRAAEEGVRCVNKHIEPTAPAVNRTTKPQVTAAEVGLDFPFPRMSWPERERWAAARQPARDSWVSQRPSDLATKAEIDTLVGALIRLRDMESGTARRRLTTAIKDLGKDVFPYFSAASEPGARQLIEVLYRRRQDADTMYKEAWQRHRDTRPVDDAAWAAELQRRAAIESEFAAAWAGRMDNERVATLTAADKGGEPAVSTVNSQTSDIVEALGRMPEGDRRAVLRALARTVEHLNYLALDEAPPTEEGAQP
jgi:hypothetical protein